MVIKYRVCSNSSAIELEASQHAASTICTVLITWRARRLSCSCLLFSSVGRWTQQQQQQQQRTSACTLGLIGRVSLHGGSGSLFYDCGACDQHVATDLRECFLYASKELWLHL